MPIYEYDCPKHGRFEKIKNNRDLVEVCPECNDLCDVVISIPAPAIIIHHQQQPYGSKSRGRYISEEETGGMGILIPSFGALEQEEVDYIAAGAIEKERDRVSKKKQYRSPYKKRMATLMSEAQKAPKGQRASTMRKLIKEGV
jgi:putative FmdB family regulatory protein